MKRPKRDSSIVVLLRIPIFRRMWAAITLSSLGDWLGLLATTALAAYLTKDSSNLAQGAAVSGVLLTRLLPDLILGPVAGALVDRVDRRKVAIIGDTLAAGLYLSMIFGNSLVWLLIAQFLVEAVGLFSTPAKQTLWVNIVPRERLAVANQLNYVSVYGMVPVAALLFALLATTAEFFGAVPDVADTGGALISGGTSTVAIDIALVLNSATFLVSAAVVYFSRAMIPAFIGERSTTKSIFSLIREGVSFVKNSRIMRAIYIGILGAFGAGGLVAGVAQAYVATLGAGNAGYSILFGSVFTGLALGMLVGPKVLPTVPRRMIFTAAIGAAGVSLIVMSLLQDFLGAVLTSAVMGLFAGIAWITGFTMIGQEVSDQLRGRVFAFVMSSVRIILLGTIAAGPILAGAVGSHVLELGTFQMLVTGPAIVLAVGGVIAILVSTYAGRQVSGLGGSALRRIFSRRRRRLIDDDDRPGVLLAVEGDDTTQVDRYAAAVVAHLEGERWEVVELSAPASVSEDTELDAPPAALRAAADLADLAAEQVRPLLDEGSVVVLHGYADALVVRFGAQGGLDESRIMRLVDWATGELRPDVTLLVDDDAPVGSIGPVGESLESADAPDQVAGPAGAITDDAAEAATATATATAADDPDPDEAQVSAVDAFRDLAASAPERYLVVRPLPPDGRLPAEAVERIASTLRLRSPQRLPEPGADPDPAADLDGGARVAKDTDDRVPAGS